MEDIQGKVLVQLLAMTILLRWQSDELGLEEQLHHQLVGNCFQHNSHLARGFQASCRQSDKFPKEKMGRFFEKCAEGDCSNESLKWKEAQIRPFSSCVIKHNKSIWNSASSTFILGFLTWGASMASISSKESISIWISSPCFSGWSHTSWLGHISHCGVGCCQLVLNTYNQRWQRNWVGILHLLAQMHLDS